MKVTLMPGIESISGSVKQKNGKCIVFKTFRKPSIHREGGKAETRMYMFGNYERSTSVTEKELAARSLFAQRAEKVKRLMTSNPRLSKKEAWEMVKKEGLS